MRSSEYSTWELAKKLETSTAVIEKHAELAKVNTSMGDKKKGQLEWWSDKSAKAIELSINKRGK